MSLIATLGAVEAGLIYALVALGVFLSFRVLSFPDLTVDGSFPLGAAVAATLITSGIHPVPATLVATASGAAAGLVTAWLNVRHNILQLLAGILTMSASFSIIIRVMGMPNMALINQPTVISLFDWTVPAIQSLGMPVKATQKVVTLLFVVGMITIALWRFLKSDFGLAMRATGANPRMARAQSISTDLYIYTGMALSNGLVGLAGALFAQVVGFADVTAGTWTIINGLAAVILGEALLRTRSIFLMLLACVLGAVAYRLAIMLALNGGWIGLKSSDLNLVTAVLVGVTLKLSTVKKPLKFLFRRNG